MYLSTRTKILVFLSWVLQGGVQVKIVAILAQLNKVIIFIILTVKLAGLLVRSLNYHPRGPDLIPRAETNEDFILQNCSTNQIAQMYSRVHDVFA